MTPEYTGRKITELRKEKLLTQKDIAETLHISIAAVSKWEHGLNFPDLSLLEPLAKLLDTSVPKLLGLENESADQVIRDVTMLSSQEKNNMQLVLIHRILLIIGLGIAFLLGIFFLGFLGNQLPFNHGIWTVLLPLFFGFLSWILAGASITSGRKFYTDRWKVYSVLSLLCCSVALYFPVYLADAYVRADDLSALMDTIWGLHFGAIALLLGTILLNGCSWILNSKKKKKDFDL